MKTLVALIAMATLVIAADYKHMSMDEMMQMKGKVPAGQQKEFCAEMQKHMQNMSPKERQKYRGMMGKGMMNNKGQWMMNNHEEWMMNSRGECMMGKGMHKNQGMMNN